LECKIYFASLICGKPQRMAGYPITND